MSTNTFGGKTIASDSFAIDLTGTFRTVAFGGNKAEATVSPTAAPSLDLG